MKPQNVDDATPILVGGADITDTMTPAEDGRSPFDLIAEAAAEALADAGENGIRERIDAVAVPRLFTDSAPRYATRLGTSSNPPRSVSRRLGLNPVHEIYPHVGGNTPQSLVNHFARGVHDGNIRAALIAGGEALRTQLAVERTGQDMSWAEDPGGTPEPFGADRPGWSEHEARHGLNAAIVFYPLFENAIRSERGDDMPAHLQNMGRLMASLAGVAHDNPRATRRDGFTASRLAHVDEENRWIGFPYPRLMNANVFVDQAAAVVITSVGVARELGIPASRWIYLNGHAECEDHWYVTQRAELHRSPAIRHGVSQALSMAGMGINELDHFDIYSCFPSALEIACREIGIAESDPRGLTVTGGLPYFGGPGNNYVTHAIVEMMRRLRDGPGHHGLVTANGYYLTKHAFGVYSTVPPNAEWTAGDGRDLQRRIHNNPTAGFTETPSGRGHVETYTVMHGRRGPIQGIVVGRESESGSRFVARTTTDQGTLSRLQEHEGLGLTGDIRQEDGMNLFDPD